MSYTGPLPPPMPGWPPPPAAPPAPADPTRWRDVLRRLHEQGRIASPWLPGMLARGENGEGPVVVVSVHARRDGDLDHYGRVIHSGGRHVGTVQPVAMLGYLLPDPSDPATLGCLLALVREASGEPHAYAWPSKHGIWTVYAASGHHPRVLGPECATEAEALLVAAEALAEARDQ